MLPLRTQGRFGKAGHRLGLVIGAVTILVAVAVVYIAWPPPGKEEEKPVTCSLSITVATDRDHYLLGETIIVLAELRNQSAPVTEAKVYMNITRPTGLSDGPYAMFDDGTRGDQEPGDGRYTTTYTLSQSDPEGVWSIRTVGEKDGCSAHSSTSFQVYLHASTPVLGVASVQAWDEGWEGVPDDVIDAGEHGLIRVAIQNTGNDIARGIQATLSTKDPLVEITDNYSGWADISPNQTQWPIDKGFQIRIDPANDKTSTTLVLVGTYMNASNHRYSFAQELTLAINKGFYAKLGSDKAAYTEGEIVRLTSTVMTTIHRLVNASVTVTLTDPTGFALGPYAMFDDGKHGDDKAGDGEYTWLAVLNQSSPTGSYKATVNATAMLGNHTFTAQDDCSLYRYARDQSGIWQVNLTGGMTYRDGSYGRWVYDENAVYQMEIQTLHYWATNTNWFRHFLPAEGKGFLFLNLAVTGRGYPNLSVVQAWSVYDGATSPELPCWLTTDLSAYDGTRFSGSYGTPTNRDSRTSLDLSGQQRRSSLLVFEVDPARMPGRLVVEDSSVKRVLLDVEIDASMLQYPGPSQAKDLTNVQGELLAQDVGCWALATDREGAVIAVYAENLGSGSPSARAQIVFAKKKSGTPVWERTMVCEVPGGVRSIAFAQDWEGAYWVAYATDVKVESDPPWSVENTSSWLTSSTDQGGEWSDPCIAFHYVKGGECNSGVSKLALAQDACGEFWLVWNHDLWKQHLLMYVRSSAGGSYWGSDPTILDDRDVGAFYADADGELHRVIPGASWIYRSSRLDYEVSPDCGQTWVDRGILIPYETSFATLYQEPSGEGSTGGWLWLVWLRSWDDTYVVEYSLDDGKSWATHAVFKDVEDRYEYSVASEMSLLGDGSDGAGRVYLFWAQPTGGEKAIYYAVIS